MNDGGADTTNVLTATELFLSNAENGDRWDSSADKGTCQAWRPELDF